MVKPHSCTSVLSFFHQFSMLGAASGFRRSFGAWRGPRSIERAGDLTRDERLRSHTGLSAGCVLCIRLPPSEQCSFQLGWQRGAALPTAAPGAGICRAGPKLGGWRQNWEKVPWDSGWSCKSRAIALALSCGEDLLTEHLMFSRCMM